MSKSPKHIHKYHKVKMFSHFVWACALRDCNHYMPYHMTDMMPGKASICWECGTDFDLTIHNMKNDKPLCPDCDPTIEAIGDMLSEFGVK